ncbi:MAG: hypothetical protein IH968_04410 [Gemmatimonadetes bacterium]|nr:hypothetical protein [Gemmatimonadota bacterium]
MGGRPEIRRVLLGLLIALVVILVIGDLLRVDSFIRSLLTFSEPPGARVRRILERVPRMGR